MVFAIAVSQLVVIRQVVGAFLSVSNTPPKHFVIGFASALSEQFLVRTRQRLLAAG